MGGSISPTTGVPASYYGNYRFTGPAVNLGQPGLGVPGPGAPNAPGMDEDYDACDLENWFMAIQSGGWAGDRHSVVPPAGDHPDRRPNNNTDDWLRQNQSNGGGQLWADSAARILRPCQADGHDAFTFPDLRPDPTTGQIPYDVDNDGDGKTDSVWVDLGYPARRDVSGRLYKPMFAFMVIGLNGRIPLNTAGNLAAQVAGVNIPSNANTGMPLPSPTPPTFYGGGSSASHLGNSVSEVDPTYGLQNGFDSLTGDRLAAFAPPQVGYLYPLAATGGQTFRIEYPGRQRRDRCPADAAPQPPRRHALPPDASPAAASSTRTRTTSSSIRPARAREQVQYFMPNGMADAFDNGQLDPNSRQSISHSLRDSHDDSRSGPVGRGAVNSRRSVSESGSGVPRRCRRPPLSTSTSSRPITTIPFARAIRSTSATS